MGVMRGWLKGGQFSHAKAAYFRHYRPPATVMQSFLATSQHVTIGAAFNKSNCETRSLISCSAPRARPPPESFR